MKEGNKEEGTETVIGSLMAKGRLSVFIILLSTVALTAFGSITSEQYVEIIKLIGMLWLGAEAGARVG